METHRKNFIILIIILVVVVVGWKMVKYSGLSPDGDTYQVVLLNNDQAFYGKLHKVFSQYPYLTDVYYLNPQRPEVDANGQPVGSGAKFTVIKRGLNEIHQPEDKLYISAKNIIYWENIGANSLVTRGIKADKEHRAKTAQEAKKTEDVKAE